MTRRNIFKIGLLRPIGPTPASVAAAAEAASLEHRRTQREAVDSACLSETPYGLYAWVETHEANGRLDQDIAAQARKVAVEGLRITARAGLARFASEWIPLLCCAPARSVLARHLSVALPLAAGRALVDRHAVAEDMTMVLASAIPPLPIRRSSAGSKHVCKRLAAAQESDREALLLSDGAALLPRHARRLSRAWADALEEGRATGSHVRSARHRLLLLHLSALPRERLRHAEQALREAAELSTPQLLAAWLIHSAALGPSRAVMWRMILEARIVAALLEETDPTASFQLALLLMTFPYGAPVPGSGLVSKTPAVSETASVEDVMARCLARLMPTEAAADALAALRATDRGLALGLLEAQAKGARAWAEAVILARAGQGSWWGWMSPFTVLRKILRP